MMILFQILLWILLYLLIGLFYLRSVSRRQKEAIPSENIGLCLSIWIVYLFFFDLPEILPKYLSKWGKPLNNFINEDRE